MTVNRHRIIILISVALLLSGLCYLCAWPPFPSVVGRYTPGGALHPRVHDGWPSPETVLSEAFSTRLDAFPKDLTDSGAIWVYGPFQEPHFFERTGAHQQQSRSWQELRETAEEIPAFQIAAVEMVEVTLRRGGLRRRLDLDNFPFQWFAVIRTIVRFEDGDVREVDFWLAAGEAFPHGAGLSKWQIAYATPVSSE